jgi:hypothetical protein
MTLFPAVAFADLIQARIKSHGCEESGTTCVIGAKYTRNHKSVSGVALRLLESLDGGDSYQKVSNHNRTTNKAGNVRFAFESPGPDACYIIVTAPNGNSKRDYSSDVLCIRQNQ